MAHQSVYEKSKSHQTAVVTFRVNGVDVGTLGQAFTYNFSSDFSVNFTSPGVANIELSLPPSPGITALTGDGTATGPGSVPFTLADTAVIPGNYTYASFTVDSKGRITAAASGAAPTGTVTSVNITSTAGTIVPTLGPVTTAGSINVEVTGLPPNNAGTDLGNPAKQWRNLVMGGSSTITFVASMSSINAYSYIDGTGQAFLDGTTGHYFYNNVQAFSASRTATWQNSSGTVAWLTDIPSVSGFLVAANNLSDVASKSAALDTIMPQGSSITSGSTVDLSTVLGRNATITGNTTINSFGTLAQGIERVVKFTGTPVITYNATSMILPTAASITAAAGDMMGLVSLGSGNWKCQWYTRADGTPLAGGGGGGTSDDPSYIWLYS